MSSSNGLSGFIKIGTAGNDDNNKRIDRIIRTIIPSLSLGSIYKEIRQGRIRINGEKTASGNRINTGDSIDIHKSLAEIVKKDVEAIISKKKDPKISPDFKELKIEILFENSFFIVINKPSGILTHTGAKTSKNNFTLDDVIKKMFIKKSQESLAFSPAPLHRLDKETSGVLFFSKSIEGARIFTSFLRKKMFTKKYIALLDGHLSKNCTWKDLLTREEKENKNPSENKEAVTHIKPLLYSSGHTLALVEIETGRFRQIRKQCAMHGFPLSGDKYSTPSMKKRIFDSAKNDFLLHCWKIELKDKKDMENTEKPGFDCITAPLPKLFIKKINALFGEDNIRKLFIDN